MMMMMMMMSDFVRAFYVVLKLIASHTFWGQRTNLWELTLGPYGSVAGYAYGEMICLVNFEVLADIFCTLFSVHTVYSL